MTKRRQLAGRITPTPHGTVVESAAGLRVEITIDGQRHTLRQTKDGAAVRLTIEGPINRNAIPLTDAPQPENPNRPRRLRR